MSDEISHQFPHYSFEEIFLRFDSIDTQLGSINNHVDSFDQRLILDRQNAQEDFAERVTRLEVRPTS